MLKDMSKKTHLSEDIMRRIDDEQIAPRAKVFFVLRNTVLWILALVSVLVGALVMSAVFFSLFNADHFIFTKLGYGTGSYLLAALPLVWLVTLSLFGLSAIYEVRHTKRGYRYPIWQLLTGLVIISLVLGYILFSMGFAHIIDQKAARYLPYYESVENRMEEMWNHPEKGLLTGVVLGTTTAGFALEDVAGTIWDIQGESLEVEDEARLQLGQSVRIVGTQTGTSTFAPCAVGHGGLMGQNEGLRKEQVMEHMLRLEEKRVGGEQMKGSGPRWQKPSGDMLGKPGAGMRRGETVLEMKPPTPNERKLFRTRTIECEGQVALPRRPGI
jgi:hypothetical protein